MLKNWMWFRYEGGLPSRKIKLKKTDEMSPPHADHYFKKKHIV
jgi:hypothetical protein